MWSDRPGEPTTKEQNQQLQVAAVAENPTPLGELAARIELLYTKALAVLEHAENTKNPGLTLTALREARGSLELVGKLVAMVQNERRAVEGSRELRILFPPGFDRV